MLRNDQCGLGVPESPVKGLENVKGVGGWTRESQHVRVRARQAKDHQRGLSGGLCPVKHGWEA